MNSDNHIDDFEKDQELKKILDYVSRLSVPRHITKDGAWANLYEAISKQQLVLLTKESPSRRIFHFAAAAIVLVAFCTYFFFHYFTSKTLTTDRGNQISFFLPDGSHVVLGSESSISYNLYHWYQNRNINLKGQAYFEVIKGSPFKVNCNNRSVTVLGTSFNVLSRTSQFKVECITGKVKVTLHNKQEHIILPGKGIKCYPGDTALVYDFDAGKGSSWTNGEFYFNEERVNHVFQEMERQFNITIQYDPQINGIYTGYFNSTSDLKQALDMVCMPMNLQYSIIDDHTVKIK